MLSNGESKYTMNTNIDFRHCHRADLPACTGIGVDAFTAVSRMFTEEEEGKMMAAGIEICYAASTYRELAMVDKEIVGLIYGQVEPNFTLIDVCRLFKQLLLILVRFLLGRYGSRRKLIRFVKPCLHEARELKRNMPSSEGVVVLFAVCPQYQGRGIGRALMDRFVRHASGCGVNILSVETDELASFWFYERYGFEKWAEFKAPLSSYLMDRPIKGFTYRLLLHKANGAESQDAGK